MGIALTSGDLQKLKSILDHRSTGYYKYKPLVQQLSGIPSREFLEPSIEKLAELARSKDFMPEDFESLIDPRHDGMMKHREFKASMTSLRGADFNIYDEEIDKLFMTFTGLTRISTTATIKIEDLVSKVYVAVKAVMIHMMQDGLKKSRQFLGDLISKRDTNHDGYLEYQEFEDMLLQDMQVGFYPKLFESIVLKQLMDPDMRQSKIKNELIKLYLGQGESAGMVVDMIPSQEGIGAGRGPAGNKAAGAQG